MVRSLKQFAQVFEPRHRDVFDAIVSGARIVRYDMSTIDFIDYPMLNSVNRAFNSTSAGDAAAPAKYVRPRGSGDIHRAVSLAAEVTELRARIAGLGAVEREFNRVQIQRSCALPARIQALLSYSPTE